MLSIYAVDIVHCIRLATDNKCVSITSKKYSLLFVHHISESVLMIPLHCERSNAVRCVFFMCVNAPPHVSFDVLRRSQVNAHRILLKYITFSHNIFNGRCLSEQPYHFDVILEQT